MATHFLFYSHFLWCLNLIAFAGTGHASILPQHQDDSRGISRVLTITNVTSLNNRFADLTIESSPYRLQMYSLNEIALGFINAMKLQALEDCEQLLFSYTYTDTEYDDSPIRLRIDGMAGASPARLIRCNLMYAIKSVAIEQMTGAGLYGALFTELYRGQAIYRGIFDDKNDPPLVEQSSNSSANTSEIATRGNRGRSTYSLDARNSTAILLTIPGSDDVEYRMEFDFVGSPLPQAGIFSAILEMMLTLAGRGSADAVQNVSEATSTDLPWIFVTHNWESTFSLQVFQLLAVLESTARHAALRGRYQEMIFNFFIDEELVAGGCVTAAVESRVWCGGISAGHLKSQ